VAISVKWLFCLYLRTMFTCFFGLYFVFHESSRTRNIHLSIHEAEADFCFNIHKLLFLAYGLHHIHFHVKIVTAVMFMNIFPQCFFIPDIGFGKEHASPVIIKRTNPDTSTQG